MRQILSALIVSVALVMTSVTHENPVLAKESHEVQSTQIFESNRTGDDFQIRFPISREVVLAIIIIAAIDLVVFVMFMIIVGAILS